MRPTHPRTLQHALQALRGLRSLRGQGEFGWLPPFLLLIVLIGGVTAKSHSFLAQDSLRAMALQAAPVLCLSAGLTPVILIGGIDLSSATLTSLCSVLLAKWLPSWGWPGLVAVIVTATLCGAIVGAIHALTQTPSFVVTLGALGVYSGMALEISNATNEPIVTHYNLISWANDLVFGVPVGFIVGVGCLTVVAALLRYLTLGRYVYAVGASELGAVMSGVRRNSVRIAAFATSGASAAIAAIVLVARTSYSSPTLADGYLLAAIAAVIVGGTAISGGLGGLGRTLIGVLTITAVEVGMIFVGVNPVLQDVVFGVAIIVAAAATTDRAKLSVIK
jgi:ribose transport system permease protein